MPIPFSTTFGTLPSIMNEERFKWQEVRMKAEDIAWIEEASKTLEQEPIRLEFLEEVLVA